MRPHLSGYWKIPPAGSGAFVAAMEDVLQVYHLQYDPRFPVVCMDESSKQLIGEVHDPIPSAPGRGRIVDHEYVRNGVAQIFVEVEPLAGRRHVEVTETRTRWDCLRDPDTACGAGRPAASLARATRRTVRWTSRRTLA